MYVSRYLYLDLQLYLYFYSGRNCVGLSFVFGEFVARCFHGCAGAGKFGRLVREFLLREIFGFPTRCSKVSWRAGRLRCRGPTSPQLRQPPVVASRRPRVSQQSMRDNCCCCCCEQSDWLREWDRVSGVTWGWSCDPWSSSGYHWGCRSRMCFGGRHDEAPLTFSHLTRWPESRWTIFILSDVHSGDKIERSNINAINVIAGT